MQLFFQFLLVLSNTPEIKGDDFFSYKMLIIPGVRDQRFNRQLFYLIFYFSQLVNKEICNLFFCYVFSRHQVAVN